MNEFLKVLLPTIVAFIATIWFQPHILKVAKTKNIVDNPNARKLQRVPIPVMGGIVVVFGILVGIMTFSLFDNINSMLSLIAAVSILRFLLFPKNCQLVEVAAVSRLVSF